MSAHLQPGRIAVIEHKTSSLDISPGSIFWQKLTLDSQASNYHVGARALEFEPVGVLYDVVRKVGAEPYVATPVELREYTKPKSKACPECKKKKATPGPHTVDGLTCEDGRIVTDPGGRLYASMREHDETLDEYRLRVRSDIASNPDKYYQRSLVVRTQADEFDAARDAWITGRQIRESQIANAWPRNTDACHQFNSVCDYWAVCSREVLISDEFRFRTAKSEHEELAEVPPVDPAASAIEAHNAAATALGEEDALMGDADGCEARETKPQVAPRVRLPVLSTSSAKAYRKCPAFYYFAYELRRRPIRSTHALRFGTLFHRGLEVWWTTVDLFASIRAMRESDDLELDAVDLIRAEELMLGYHARWSEERLNVLAVEAQFEGPMVNPMTGQASRTWMRGGKMDAIVQAATESAEAVAPAPESAITDTAAAE